MKQQPESVIKEKIFSMYKSIFYEFIKPINISSYKQFINRWSYFNTMILEAADCLFLEHIKKFSINDKTLSEKIEAESVVIEIVDHSTGKIYRRNLPLHYLETDNGIKLSGETSDGKPSDITFLSDTALKRINDLTGKGPDFHRCKD